MTISRPLLGRSLNVVALTTQVYLLTTFRLVVVLLLLTSIIVVTLKYLISMM